MSGGAENNFDSDNCESATTSGEKAVLLKSGGRKRGVLVSPYPTPIKLGYGTAGSSKKNPASGKDFIYEFFDLKEP